VYGTFYIYIFVCLIDQQSKDNQRSGDRGRKEEALFFSFAFIKCEKATNGLET
jgi:hypothetical protein